jgi:NADPH-dependent 2,4-dienoyl-CoA reductase/sulfur reductase-like enzyme
MMGIASLHPSYFILRVGLGIVTKRQQVVIVGAGPVGTALAVDLGLRGVSCMLVERSLR